MTKNERRKKKNLIFMGIAAVVLIAALLLLNSLKDKDNEVVAKESSFNITNLKAGELSYVSYKYKGKETLNYEFTNSKWVNPDDDNFPLSSNAFGSQFVNVFVTLKTDKVVENPDKDLSKYGMDDPYLILEVTSVKDDSKKTYTIGDYNPSIGKYYMQISGDDNLYMISDDLLFICREDMYDYASVDSFPGYSLNTLDYLEFANKGVKQKLEYHKDGAEEDFIGYTKWFFAEPFSRIRPCEDSRMETFVTDVVSLFGYTKTSNYNASDEELEEYGLKNSETYYTIHYTEENADGTKTSCSTRVVIGKATSDGNSYYTREIKTKGLAVESSRVVRLVDKFFNESVTGLDPLKYIYLNVFYVKLDDILNTSMVVTTKDKEYKIEYKGEAQYYINDKKIEESPFEDFYYHLIKVSPERILYDKSLVKDGEVVYKITANRNKDDYFKTTTIEYVKYDSTYYLARLNGVADTLVNMKDIDAVMTELQGLDK